MAMSSACRRGAPSSPPVQGRSLRRRLSRFGHRIPPYPSPYRLTRFRSLSAASSVSSHAQSTPQAGGRTSHSSGYRRIPLSRPSERRTAWSPPSRPAPPRSPSVPELLAQLRPSPVIDFAGSFAFTRTSSSGGRFASDVLIYSSAERSLRSLPRSLNSRRFREPRGRLTGHSSRSNVSTHFSDRPNTNGWSTPATCTSSTPRPRHLSMARADDERHEQVAKLVAQWTADRVRGAGPHCFPRTISRFIDAAGGGVRAADA